MILIEMFLNISMKKTEYNTYQRNENEAFRVVRNTYSSIYPIKLT